MGKLAVLIVDDSFLMRDIIKDSIKDAIPGVAVSLAGNGDEARKKLTDMTFNLVLCDWEMPELNGNELLKWLREDSSQKTIPFIMITAKGDRDSILEVMKLGVTDYIVKPFSPEVLCQKVLAVLKKSGWSEPRRPGGLI
jgi:DNA-binding response OmpR family regulator